MKLNRLVAVMILSLVMVMAAFVVAHAEVETPVCPDCLIEMVFDSEKVTTEPTCANEGVKTITFKCPSCGKTETATEKLAATGEHNFTRYQAISGDEEYHNAYCSVCKDYFKVAHNYEEYRYVAPTCLNEGAKYYRCEDCRATKSETVQATGEHNYYILNSVEATCEHGGYDNALCLSCYRTYRINETEKLPDHVWDITVVAPTCIAQGHTDKVCKFCGKEVIEDFVEALGHDFVEVPEVPATCDKDGKEAYKKCSACGELEDKEGAAIPALNHKNKVTVLGVDSTCSKEGYKGYYKCPDCGKVSLDGSEWVADDEKFEPIKIEKKAHTWETKAAKAATCTEDGWEAYDVCKVCGELKAETKAIPATNHKNAVLYKEVPATCTEDGKIAYAKCPDCNKFFSLIVDEKDFEKSKIDAEVTEKDLVIVKLGHGDWKLLGDKEPTCTEKGNTGALYCGRCNVINPDTLPEEIDALGHIWERKGFDPEKAEYVIVEATCQKEGSKTLVCECGEKKVDPIAKDTEHKNFYKVIEKVEATCTEDGYEKRACELCDYTAKITIKAEGHVAKDVERIEPTATEPGRTAGVICEVCEKVLRGCEEIPATGEDDPEYGKYSITINTMDSNATTGKVIVEDGEAYDKVYARVTVWFNNFDNYITMRAEVIDGEFEVGYGVNNFCGITVVVTTTKNCASVPMSSCNILAAVEK